MAAVTALPMPPCEGVAHADVTLRDGLTVHVATAGPVEGPPVVLLHGWPQHWWCWHGVIPGLAAAGFRILAPDLRGCGWTDAPADGPYDKEQLATDLLALLDVLGHDRVQLVGHDWGGWTAQLAALRAPDRVQRLVTVDIAPVCVDPRAVLGHLPRYAYQPLAAAPLLGSAVQRSPRFARIGYPGVPRDLREEYARVLRDPARARAGSLFYRTFLTKELPGVVAGRYRGQRVAAPLLVLHGTRDPVIRPAVVEQFRRLADDVTIEYVEGAGHFLPDERPDLVADRLLAFLDR